MKLYEHGDLRVFDGGMPGSIVIQLRHLNTYDDAVLLVESLTERQALELANALTHGKLQTLLDAIDASMASEDGDLFAHLEPIDKARKALL